jgi:hypothetical protein
MPLSLRDAAQPQVLVVRRYARVTSDHIELPAQRHDHEDFFYEEGSASYCCTKFS